GDIEIQLRYDAYGKEIIRADSAGTPVVATDEIKHEYTGHEREHVTGLIYAGARYLDPDLAQFLTEDPNSEFASPYAYGPWDPINGSVPSGASWLGIFVGIVLGALAVHGVGQALYGLAAGIATGNGFAIFASLAGLSFAGIGLVIAPASAMIGLANAKPI